MDLTHDHPTQVYVLVASNSDAAPDLIAVGGEHSVEILLVGPSSTQSVALFHIGTRITALAWSSRSRSPSSTDEWFFELAAAASDFSLHLLTKSTNDDESVFHFGGGLSGHHGKINDIAFCGGTGSDSSRYVATVSDDKMLMVWDLEPPSNVNMTGSPETGSPSRPQPTAYGIPFPHPLTSIDSHPSTSKEFLVSDCRGTIYITDWRTDPGDSQQEVWRNTSVVELTEPHALSDASLGLSVSLSGSAVWRRDSADIIGAAYGTRFSLWDISKLQGGKPFATCNSFSQGGQKFRWCHTYPEYFAISTHSPLKGAIINVYNTNYVFAQPTVFNIAPRPHFVRDFDFLSARGIPRLAAAVGRSIVIFPIGVES